MQALRRLLVLRLRAPSTRSAPRARLAIPCPASIPPHCQWMLAFGMMDGLWHLTFVSQCPRCAVLGFFRPMIQFVARLWTALTPWTWTRPRGALQPAQPVHRLRGALRAVYTRIMSLPRSSHQAFSLDILAFKTWGCPLPLPQLAGPCGSVVLSRKLEPIGHACSVRFQWVPGGPTGTVCGVSRYGFATGGRSTTHLARSVAP